MFHPDQYQLLDFGRGEKLESFAGAVVRRSTPSVAQYMKRAVNSQWNCGIRFQGSDAESGEKSWDGDVPENWRIKHGTKTFLLKPTPAGQVGVFPEQAVNWEWIDSLPQDLAGLSALNLFGYTGGTTLALAQRGVEVVHVDSARNVMNWARQNAAASNMDALPIRWIVEDAMKFVRREVNRNTKYDILVADPPSYGKGPKRERWKMEADFEDLLSGLSAISNSRPTILLLSCHTPGFDAERLQQLAKQYWKLDGSMEKLELQIKSMSEKTLDSGSCFRYHATN